MAIKHNIYSPVYIQNLHEEIAGLDLSINAIDITSNISACMTIQDIQKATKMKYT